MVCFDAKMRFVVFVFARIGLFTILGELECANSITEILHRKCEFVLFTHGQAHANTLVRLWLWLQAHPTDRRLAERVKIERFQLEIADRQNYRWVCSAGRV